MRINRVENETAGTKKPVLSIGMIFKNEIRCLERCMKALQPLRDAVPCELVMADTGSDDGSREIAEQYADILFDFPWINDFAAARNAVMDRCSGEWYFSIDCDEWLDSNIKEVVSFFTSRQHEEYVAAGLVIRNYNTESLDRYSDMMGVRFLRMDTGVRFVGKIHEAFFFGGGETSILSMNTYLHHDGYIWMGTPKGQEKHERNMKLLKEKLEEDPENLRTLVECVESEPNDGIRRVYLERAVKGVKEKKPHWITVGPSILRYNASIAYTSKLPDFEERAAEAMEWFPDSMLVQIDVSYFLFRFLMEKHDYAAAIPWGEKYFEGIAEYHSGSARTARALAYGTLIAGYAGIEHEARVMLANGYYENHDYDKSQKMIRTVDLLKADQSTSSSYIKVILNLHSIGKNVTDLLMAFWKRIEESDAKETRAGELRTALVDAAGPTFQKGWRDKETEEGRRHAYTLFLPLEGKCETGLAAAVLEEENPEVLTEKLLTVEEWSKFSIHALAHALERGVQFPLPGKKMTVEEMDELADRMRKTGDVASLAVESSGQVGTVGKLCWSRSLLLSAMREEAERQRQTKKLLGSSEAMANMEEDIIQIQRSIETIRVFAEVERKFLAVYYAPEMLTEENLSMLPPMHRFGWHCARAFDALDAGDALGCVHALKAGLSSCESMQPVVEFLLEHIPALKVEKPSRELQELAEKVRTMLAAYAPDDPAVAALKESPAYQRVAHLIEEPEPLQTDSVQ